MKTRSALSIKDASRGIDDMSIYALNQYRKTLDLNWFITTYTGREKKLPEELLRPVESLILNEYHEAMGDGSFVSYLQRYARIKNLQDKYDMVLLIVKTMLPGFPNTRFGAESRLSLIKELEAHQLRMDHIATPAEDYYALQRIENEAGKYITQIHLLENALKQEGKKDEVRFEKIKQAVIIATGHPGFIDRNFTVAEWIELYKSAMEKAQQN